MLVELLSREVLPLLSTGVTEAHIPVDDDCVSASVILVMLPGTLNMATVSFRQVVTLTSKWSTQCVANHEIMAVFLSTALRE